MSKAFTKDDVSAPQIDVPLPVGRRPITPQGLEQLRAELDQAEKAVRQAHLQMQRGETLAQDRTEVLEKRLQVLRRKIELSDVISQPTATPERVALGTRVVVREDESEELRTYAIVGPDEVDYAKGRVTLGSPVGQALSGHRVGERALIKRPRGLLEVWVVSIERDSDG